MVNKFINFYFESYSGYWTSTDRDRVYEYCFLLGRTLSPMIDIWGLMDSMLRLLKKHRNDSNNELYKALTSMVINNYKKQNRGVNDRGLNSAIRDYVTDDFNYMYRVLYDCELLYKEVLVWAL